MSADEEQIQARACWLYYNEGLTQAHIAEKLRTTRVRVNRLLAEARNAGLVQVSLNMPLESCVRLERRLVREFGLGDAIVLPSPVDPSQISATIGRAAGEYLSRLMEERSPGVVGVGWGATLRETIRFVRAGQYPAVQVTSMMGGLTYGYDLNTFEIASELARRWNARCHYLAAPIYAGSRRSRDVILDQDVFREAFDRLRQCEIAVLSIGDLTPRSLLIRNGLPRDVTAAELAACGAVGDILGQFVDSKGREIAHALNSRAIAFALTDLRQIPTVILASGGEHKVAAIVAALSSGLIDVLICDERTVAAAIRLLEGSRA